MRRLTVDTSGLKPQLDKQADSVQEARLLNNATWTPLAELTHPATVAEPASAIMYKEVEEGHGAMAKQGPSKAQPPQKRAPIAEPKSRYVIQQLPVNLPNQKPPLDKANPKLGVGEPSSPGSTWLIGPDQ